MADLDERRVATRAGAGLVVRAPGVVAVVGDGAAGTGLVVDACRAAAVEGPTPAAALDLRLRAALAAGVTPLPALAVLTGAGDGRLHLVVHGSANATAVLDGEEIALDGRAATLETIALDPPVTEVRMSVGAVPASTDGRADVVGAVELVTGVVPGAAAVLDSTRATVGLADPAGDAAPPRRPEAASATVGPGEAIGETAAPVPASVPGTSAPPITTAAAEPPTARGPAGVVRPSGPDRRRFESVLLMGGTSGPGADDVRPPLPVGAAPTTPAGTTSGPADTTSGPGAFEVDLVRCPAGHPTDPASSSCRVCDRPLSPDAVVERGPRPALGLLVLDDGASFVLDADYVIGRSPAGDPQVRAGRARPLVVDDADRTVSRVHAEVRADGWEVRIDDRGSTNGTFVWDPAARDWVRLVPSEPRRLLPGDRAAVGHRTFRLETRLLDDT